MDRDDQVKVMATQRTLWDMQGTYPDVPIKYVFAIANMAIDHYRRGSGISDPRALELFTHPDVVEQAELLAERFRVMVYEDDNDGRPDAAVDLAVEMARNADLECPPGEAEERELLELEALALQVIHTMARKMFLRVLDSGDWNEE